MRPFFAPFLAPLLALLTAGCAGSLPPLYQPAADAVAREAQPLAVELRSRDRVVLRGVYVIHDSLVGRDPGSDREHRIAVVDVASITRTRAEPHPVVSAVGGMFAGFLVGITGVAGLLILASR